MVEYKDNHDPIGIQITTSKLNGKNYLLLWAQFVRVYLGARKLKFVTSKKVSLSDAESTKTAEEEWDIDNFMVLTWLWNNMEPYVSTNSMFHTSAKTI